MELKSDKKFITILGNDYDINNLTEIPKDIKYLKKIQELYLYVNQIRDITHLKDLKNF